MEKENFMSFKIEGEILTLEEVDETEKRGNCPYHFRLAMPETGELRKLLSTTKITYPPYIRPKLQSYTIHT